MITVFINHELLKEHCPYDNNVSCLREFILIKLRIWATLLVIDSICVIIFVHLLIKRATYPIISILGIFQALFLYLLSDQTVNDKYYIGIINALHILLILILFAGYMITLACKKIYQKNRKYFVASLVFIFACFAIFYHYKVASSCDYWPIGING